MEKNFNKMPFENKNGVGPNADYYKKGVDTVEMTKIDELAEEALHAQTTHLSDELLGKPTFNTYNTEDQAESREALNNKRETYGFKTNIPVDYENLLGKFELQKQEKINDLTKRSEELLKKKQIIQDFYESEACRNIQLRIETLDKDIQILKDKEQTEEMQQEIEDTQDKKKDLVAILSEMTPPECYDEEEIENGLEAIAKEQALLINYIDSEVQ
jgi:hypothetical protein